VLAVVSFFHAWEIDLSAYQWAREYGLAGINAPVVDFVAIIALCSLLGGVLLGTYRIDKRRIMKIFPIFVIYGMFLGIGLFSALDAYSGLSRMSLHYLVRPMFFVALVYMLLPTILAHRDYIIDRVIYIWFVVGGVIATFGFASLVVVDGGVWQRIQPYAVAGFAPLGYNHNLLAEPLVVIVPLGIYLWIKYKKNWIAWITAGMFFAALFTFSRAAWIAYIVMGISFAFVYKDRVAFYLKKYRNYVVSAVIVVLVPLLLMMGLFLQSSIVKSSNDSRIEMTRIAVTYTQIEPWIGYGPGMFVPLLSDTKIFVEDFGDPLDAHGFIQKIVVEEGLIGLVAFVVFLYMILLFLLRASQRGTSHEKAQIISLMCGVVGIVTFQLFNTSYFNSVMWMPIGIALASASHIYMKYE